MTGMDIPALSPVTVTSDSNATFLVVDLDPLRASGPEATVRWGDVDHDGPAGEPVVVNGIPTRGWLYFRQSSDGTWRICNGGHVYRTDQRLSAATQNQRFKLYEGIAKALEGLTDVDLANLALRRLHSNHERAIDDEAKARRDHDEALATRNRIGTELAQAISKFNTISKDPA